MSFGPPDPINQIIVSLDFGSRDPITVGRLALRAGRVYFEYNGEFIRSGLEISPLRCPLRPGVQTFDPHLFKGLPGVFNDSLPDGWGSYGLFWVMASIQATQVSVASVTSIPSLNLMPSMSLGN